MSESWQVPNLFNVHGKTCIVTGGGTGIGRGMATSLAVNGAKVIICGRRPEIIEQTAREINFLSKEAGHGGEVIPIPADVSNKKDIVVFYEQCAKMIDKLDYLVNNAGYSISWRDGSAWMTAMHVAGPYFLAVKFIPLFKKSNDPSVCNITSLAATFLNRRVCEFSYAQSKAAEQQLTRLMAGALAPLGIRVNSVAPGMFPSQLTQYPDGKYLEPMAESQGDIPAKRPGTWQELAGVVIMLASPAGSYINGSDFVIDGGWALVRIHSSCLQSAYDTRLLPARTVEDVTPWQSRFLDTTACMK